MTLLSLLKIFHLLGLVMGLGGAVLADVILLRFGVLRPLRDDTVRQLHSAARVVLVGLLLLWISGLAIFKLRAGIDPAFAANPKFWSKMGIVCILTVNGIVLHCLVLPRLRRKLGRRLFDGLASREIAALTLMGAISSVSWFTPLVLGAARELNFTTPAWQIMTVYGGLVAGGWLAGFGFARWLLPALMASPRAEAKARAPGPDQQYVRLLARIRLLKARLGEDDGSSGAASPV